MIRALVLGGFLLAGTPAVDASGLVLGSNLLDQGRIQLNGKWSYRLGDDPAWASPELDTADWATGGPELSLGGEPAEEWDGLGWFRLRLRVDEGLGVRPLGLSLVLAGACEIFVDGERIVALGRVASLPNESEEIFTRRVIWLTLSPRPQEHLLAVRLSNHRLDELAAMRRFAGFSADLALPESLQARFDRPPRGVAAEQALFTGVGVAFGLLHLLLFLHDRRGRENLYLSLVIFAFAIAAFLDFQKELDAELGTSLLLHRLHRFVLPVWLVLSARLVYSLFLPRVPRRFWIYLAVGAAGLAVGLVEPSVLWTPLELVGLIIFADIVLTATVLARRQRKEDFWILGLGMALFSGAASIDLIVDLGLVEQFMPTSNPYLYGSLAFLLSMSIYLARSFGRTTLDLERQLVRVRDLSQQTLAQERAAREQEVSRRLLEADRDRKSRELEEARALQLSMLPDEQPSTSDWEVAAAMLTATEVGGDYYDFRLLDDGSLLVAVGDAVGHGARAGTLVAATKSLFSAPDLEGDPGELLERFHQAMRRMNLSRAHMALTLARFGTSGLAVASAGMPPPLVWRAGENRVEELNVAGLPLGSAVRRRASTREVSLEPGDIVLLMSDGLPELRGPGSEELGYERTAEHFRRQALRPPGQIIEGLMAVVGEWTGGEAPGDDVTLVVVKARQREDGQ